MLNISFIGVLFSDRLMCVSLLAFTLQLQLLKFLRLRFIPKIMPLQIRFQLPLRALGFLDLTSQLHKLLVLFVFQKIAVSSQFLLL